MADYAKNCGIDYDKAMNLVCSGFTRGFGSNAP